jgi:hypothetical protein
MSRMLLTINSNYFQIQRLPTGPYNRNTDLRTRQDVYGLFGQLQGKVIPQENTLYIVLVSTSLQKKDATQRYT